MAIKYVNNELEYEYEDGLAIKRKPERKKSTASGIDRSEKPIAKTGRTASSLNGESRQAEGTTTGLGSSSIEVSPVETPSRTFRTRAANGTFDKLKYQREYHREYRRHQRAKKKAEQENVSE